MLDSSAHYWVISINTDQNEMAAHIKVGFFVTSFEL